MRLKESMKMMGLSNWMHWFAWFVKIITFFLIIIILQTILLKVKVSFFQHIVTLTVESRIQIMIDCLNLKGNHDFIQLVYMRYDCHWGYFIMSQNNYCRL